MAIAHIMEAIRGNRVRVTDHADEEATADGLTYADVAHSVLRGEIIEKGESRNDAIPKVPHLRRRNG